VYLLGHHSSVEAVDTELLACVVALFIAQVKTKIADAFTRDNLARQNTTIFFIF
jgi:hypothetical protein